MLAIAKQSLRLATRYDHTSLRRLRVILQHILHNCYSGSLIGCSIHKYRTDRNVLRVIKSAAGCAMH
jgi:hypothetical protein